MLEIPRQTAEAAAVVRDRWNRTPRVGIILGTGLGNFTQEITAEAVIPYQDIPHFPRSTAVGHKGQLVCGLVGGLPVVTMEGRFHAYEGYKLAMVTLPVRVMKALGIEVLIVSNAAGGMNPHYASGDIMVIEDHINLMGSNPLTGIHEESLGARFPDMSCPYDPQLMERAIEIARSENFTAHKGVYVALSGPNYETRAEYRFLRRIGGDVVGMSTVPEVIVASQIGLRVLALSAVTNVCLPDAIQSTDGHAVVEAAKKAEWKMRKIVLGTLADQLKAMQ